MYIFCEVPHPYALELVWSDLNGVFRYQDLLDTKYGDYEWLEFQHGYIQWLFPIREDGTVLQVKTLVNQSYPAGKFEYYFRKIQVKL